jgi:hypothetical protein
VGKQRTRCLLYRDNLPYLPPTYEMAYVLIELVSPNPASHMPREMGADVLHQARHDQSTHHPPYFFNCGIYSEHLWQVIGHSPKLLPLAKHFAHQVRPFAPHSIRLMISVRFCSKCCFRPRCVLVWPRRIRPADSSTPRRVLDSRRCRTRCLSFDNNSRLELSVHDSFPVVSAAFPHYRHFSGSEVRPSRHPSSSLSVG